MMPRCKADVAACVRSSTPSFDRTFFTWFFTVYSAIFSSLAICLLPMPRTMSASTSSSRAVSSGRARSGLERPPNLFVAGVRAERDESRQRRSFANRAHRLDAAHHGHADVHQGDIGPMPFVQLHRFGAVGGFGHNLHVGLRLDDGTDAHAGNQVIFGDQHADWLRGHDCGTRTSTVVPF